jgi:3-hydroxymyristoyl/3-hydroxydecanoyl-(acyl carrier protein) dehydratase
MSRDEQEKNTAANTDIATRHAPLRIARSHPSLPGHFPGRPIVPGVVVLDHVLAAAEAWLGRAVRLRTLKQAKFVTPLLPEQEAQVEIKLQGDELRFAVTRDGEAIAQGLLSVDAGVTA